MAITLKQAAENAEYFLRDLVGDGLHFLRVEEAEETEDGLHWIVTLGWVEPARTAPTSLLPLQTAIEKLPRTYKQFKIDKESGEVVSMKIREV